MILFIFVLAALLLFLVAVLGKPTAQRRLWIGIIGAVLIGSVVVIALNDASRFGMKTTTTTQTVRIVGAANHTVFATPVGAAKKAYAVAYRANPLSKKVTVAKPSITTAVRVHRTNANAAQLTMTRTKLQYQNTLAAILFAGSGQNGQVLRTTYTFHIPLSWAVISKR